MVWAESSLHSNKTSTTGSRFSAKSWPRKRCFIGSKHSISLSQTYSGSFLFFLVVLDTFHLAFPDLVSEKLTPKKDMWIKTLKSLHQTYSLLFRWFGSFFLSLSRFPAENPANSRLRQQPHLSTSARSQVGRKHRNQGFLILSRRRFDPTQSYILWVSERNFVENLNIEQLRNENLREPKTLPLSRSRR